MSDFRATIASGTRLIDLAALRDVLIAAIVAPETRPGEVAALSKQLSDVLIQIEALAPPKTVGTPLDELDERRRGRGASAPRKERPAR